MESLEKIVYHLNPLNDLKDIKFYKLNQNLTLRLQKKV